MRVTDTVHELINYLKQYEKYYPAAGETTVNPEPWTWQPEQLQNISDDQRRSVAE